MGIGERFENWVRSINLLKPDWEERIFRKAPDGWILPNPNFWMPSFFVPKTTYLLNDEQKDNFAKYVRKYVERLKGGLLILMMCIGAMSVLLEVTTKDFPTSVMFLVLTFLVGRNLEWGRGVRPILGLPRVAQTNT